MKKHTSNGTGAARTQHTILNDVLYSSALYSRHGKTVAGIALSLAGAMSAHDAYANPTDAHVASGDVKLSNPTAKDLVVTQSTNKAVINWGSFNINTDESTRFVQPGSSSVTLNRINNGNASQILGKLDANGQVMIVNPNGVFFGHGAQVNVGGLVASTANISDQNFNAGNYKFDQAGAPNASIINQGNITAAQGGLVALVAPNVRNDGTIAANMGTVALGAGSTATIDLYGDNLINFQVDSATGANITNNGTIKSGTVLMTANDANQLVNNVINNTGIIDASSAHEDGGSIVLDGGNGAVNLTGTLDVSGMHGGQVSVTGEEVTVDTGTFINATGTNGGGTVKIGGDYQGGGTLKHAQKVDVKAGSAIDASATDNGNGGTVVLWSDAETNFAGDIKANAGANGGNGGLIETSSQGTLTPTGTISASAAHGEAGTWLLDPADITISNSNFNETGAPNYQPTGSFSSVKASDIQTALNAGTNVSVKTTNNASFGSGDINVNSSINSTGAGNLTLSAYHDVKFGLGTSITTQGGSVTIGADNTAKHSGLVSFYGSNSITTNGGNIVIGGGLNPTTDFAYGGSTATNVLANYQFDGYNAIYNTVGQAGVAFGQGTTINSGAGNITINGHGGTGGYSNTGIYMEDTTIKSTTGNISIKGTAGDGNGTGSVDNVTKDQGIVVAGGGVVTTVDGAINMNGTGGINGVGSNETGIVNYGAITATGNGSITMTGTGGGKGANSDNNYGIWNNGIVQTVNGTLTANGQGGGNASGRANVGIYIGRINEASGGAAGPTFRTTGTGNMFLNGFGGNNNGSGGYNIGVYDLVVGGIQATGTGNITINGAGSNATEGYNQGVQINPGATVTANGGNITINGNNGSTTSTLNGNDGVNIQGTVSTVGNGTITLTGTGGGQTDANGVEIYTGGKVQSASGKITVNGTASNDTDGVANNGVRVMTGGTIATTAGGDITIGGTGKDSSGDNQIGVLIEGAVTGSGGAIAITGTGGNGTGNFHDGVRVNGGSITNIAAGGLSITGTAGVTSGNSHDDRGVIVMAGGKVSTVNNLLTVTGMAGGAGSGLAGVGNNIGVYLKDAGSSISNSGTGTIAVTGFGNGGNGSSSNNHGVLVETGTAIQSTGTGTINVAGNGGNGSGNNNAGVYINGAITGNSNTVNITGNAGNGNGNYKDGIVVAGAVSATGGNITMNGTGGAGHGNNNIGVLIAAGGSVTDTGGRIQIAGMGGNGPDDNNTGIEIGGTVSNTNTGTVHLIGTGNGGTTSSLVRGLNVTGGTVSTANGDITISGSLTASSTASADMLENDNAAVFLNGGTVKTTGAGNINITGTGATGVAFNSLAQNIGVWVHNSNVNAQGTGNITINGTGGLNPSGAHGVLIRSGSNVAANGGNILVNGNGGAGTDVNVGVYLLDGTISNKGAGTITVNGTSSGTGASNYGVAFDNGAITSTGTGTITVNSIGGGDKTAATNNIGLEFLNRTNTIGGATFSGDIHLNQDTMALPNGADNIQTTSTVYITPITNNTSIGVGTGTGTLALTDAILSGVNASKLVIGDRTLTGSIDYKSALTFAEKLWLLRADRNTGSFTIESQINSTATGAGSIVVVSGGNFINTAGVTPLNTPNGDSELYLSKLLLNGSLATNTLGGFTYGHPGDHFVQVQNTSFEADAPTELVDTLHWTNLATLTVTANNASKTYGDVDPTFTKTATGFAAGDNAANSIVETSPWWTVSCGNGVNCNTSNAGNYSLNVNLANVTSNNGYIIVAGPAATFTINKANLAIKANDLIGTYGSVGLPTYTATGLKLGQTVGSVTLTPSTGYSTSGNVNAGTGTIAASNATGGTFSASNYNISYTNGVINLAKKTLTTGGTITANNKVYDATTVATLNTAGATVSGQVAGDVVAFNAAGATGAFADKNVGNNKVVTVSGTSLSGADAANYSIAPFNLTANITPASLTIKANDKASTYGDGAVLNTSTDFTATGLVGGETIGEVLLVDNATISSAGHRNAGTWNITASNASLGTFNASNYNITYTGGTWAIAKKTVTTPNTGIGSITANNKTYDGNTNATLNTAGATISGIVTGDVVALNTAGATGTFNTKDVGTAKPVTVSGITISGTDAANYSFVQPTGVKADITAKGLTISANNKSSTYGDGATLNGSTGFTATGLVGGETVGSVTLADNATLSTSGNKNAGTWNIAASNATGGTFNASNYAISYTNGTWTIAKKTVTTPNTGVGAITANNKVYDATTAATLNTAGATISGIVTGDVVALNTAGATGTFADKNVGTGKAVTVSGLTISGTDAANYSFVQPTGVIANITARGLTIKANDKNSVYGDGATLNGATGFTATGLQGGETVGSVALADNATNSTSGNKQAGTWAITASNATGGTFAASNYAITYTNGTWNIAKKTVTTPNTGVGAITANNKTYDGNTNATLNTAGATISGIVGTDVVNINTAGATGTFNDKNVGTAKPVTVAGITISGTDANNYSFIQPTGVKADITAATLTIKANDKSSTYGDGSVLGTTGYTATGLVGGETIGSVTLADNAALSTSGNKQAGTWTITASNATGGTFNASNYAISYQNGTWTIAKKILTTNGSITANNKTYDATTTATLNTAGASVSGQIAGDIVAINTAGATGTFADKNVGTNKAVTVTGTALTGTDAGNYTIAPLNLTANITAASLTIKANDKSSTYGDGAVLNGTTGFTATGLQGGETVGSVTLADNATTSTSGNKQAGTWAITANNATGGTFAASNYAITYTNGAWTIAKKDISTPNTGVGSITAQNKTYDGNTNATLNTAGATLSGIVGTDVVAINTAGATGTFNTKDAGTAKPVTVAGIAISGTDAANYNFIQPTGVKADITAATLTIKANDKSSTYGDGATLNNITGYTATGLVGGETIGSVTLADNATNSTSGNKKAGTWTITASNATGGTFNAANYAISYQNGTWTIAQKVLNTNGTITANNKTYDATTTATLNTSGASVTGQISGDVVAFDTTGATGTFADKNVGNNKAVTVTGTALTGADAGNYTIAPLNLTANITPASLTIKANDKTSTYSDGATLNGTTGFTATGLQGGETVGSVALADNATNSTSGNKKAGTWTITASNATGGTFAASNYTINYANGTWVINKKTVSTPPGTGVGSITAQNKTYDGNTNATLNTAGATISGIAAGDVVALNTAGATGTFADKNAGTNKAVTVAGLTISGTDAANYSFVQPTGVTANITAAALNIKANDKTSTYNDGTTLNGATDFTATGLVGGETIGSVTLADNASLSTGGHKNAGTWAITASNATGGSFNASNYAISYTNGTWVINKKTISTPPGTGVGSITAQNKTYDGNTNATLNTTGATLTGIGSGDVVAINTTGATGTFDTKNVGTNKAVTVAGITITGADAANYSFVQPSGVTANITAAGLTVSANNKNSVYGDGATLNGATGFTATGLAAGETIDSVTLTDNATVAPSGNKNAGTWAITASNATGASFNASNYAITYTNGTWVIDKKTISTPPGTGVGSITAQNKTYDGNTNATLNTAGATLSGIMAGDVVALNTAGATGTFDTKNVGTGKAVTVSGITITGAQASNYSFVQPSGVTANITGAALTIKANDKTSTYADGATLNGSTGFTATGLVGGETVGSVTLTDNATLSTSNQKEAGTWAITASNATGGTFVASNYVISYTNGTWVIDKKTISTPPGTGVGSITAQNKVYDGTTAATLNTAGATLTGINGTDVVAMNTAGATGTFDTKNVGTGKTVTVAGITLTGTDAANYSFVSPTGVTADITPRALIVSATGTNKTYDGTTDATVTLSDNRIAGDILNDTYGSATFADKNAGINKPITVTGINVFGTDAGNYTFNTTASTTATINKAALAVVADNVSGPVGTIPPLTYTYSGLVGGDTNSVFSGGLATSATTTSPAGSYDITLGTLTAGINYAINFSGGTNALTLTGGSTPFALANTQRVYVDATPPAPTVFSYAGVLIPQGQQAPQFGTALTANVSMLGSGAVATSSLNNLTPAAGGNLGNLSPSAGGTLGDLSPAAGSDAELSANTCINTYLDNPLKNDCRRDNGI